jgi:hypothetical protein
MAFLSDNHLCLRHAVTRRRRDAVDDGWRHEAEVDPFAEALDRILWIRFGRKSVLILNIYLFLQRMQNIGCFDTWVIEDKAVIQYKITFF